MFFNNLASKFKCAKNRDVEDFLKTKAVLYEKTFKCRTYLVFEENTYNLVAYFSLALDVLDIKGLSKTVQKKISGLFVIDQVAIFLIGQLGRCDSAGNHLISGEKLLDLCFGALNTANGIIGGRCVLVECENSAKLIDYYVRNQFKQIKTLESDSNMIQMIRFL